jgi:hypothetical protein
MINADCARRMEMRQAVGCMRGKTTGRDPPENLLVFEPLWYHPPPDVSYLNLL